MNDIHVTSYFKNVKKFFPKFWPENIADSHVQCRKKKDSDLIRKIKVIKKTFILINIFKKEQTHFSNVKSDLSWCTTYWLSWWWTEFWSRELSFFATTKIRLKKWILFAATEVRFWLLKRFHRDIWWSKPIKRSLFQELWHFFWI